MKIINKKKFNIKTCNGIYEVILEKWDEDKGYVVRVIDLPEIITEGKSITEAKKMAKEAIELCLECDKNEHYSNIKSKRRLTAPTKKLYCHFMALIYNEAHCFQF